MQGLGINGRRATTTVDPDDMNNPLADRWDETLGQTASAIQEQYRAINQRKDPDLYAPDPTALGTNDIDFDFKGVRDLVNTAFNNYSQNISGGKIPKLGKQRGGSDVPGLDNRGIDNGGLTPQGSAEDRKQVDAFLHASKLESQQPTPEDMNAGPRNLVKQNLDQDPYVNFHRYRTIPLVAVTDPFMGRSITDPRHLPPRKLIPHRARGSRF